ncbi:RNA-binding protein [Paraburkholderia sp. NMBU_R16]|uniref:YhbY family RNA-binding protein n=1 Tax=Paraburkholderia sp. NMBU_R16 TaxID=2698676 RepID=UPI001565FE09|nr:YhbY family RNA-binding protein [Paraburkholderia sp. NMBU_R16]NRO98458.1 RNA-binding protein [Paraburkholderia sp. NMBU_R16]
MPALKVSPAQRAELRAQAHALKPVVLIGGDGLTDAVLAEIKVHLAAHELIKIRVFGDEREARAAIYEQICDTLGAAPIQHIGKLLVVWKPQESARPAATKPAGRTATAKTPASPKTAGRAGGAGAARSRAVPSVQQAAGEKAGRGAAPRLVKVIKPSDNPKRRPKPQTVVVRGNERVTAGGTVKRAKKRQTSAKRQHQTVK